MRADGRDIADRRFLSPAAQGRLVRNTEMPFSRFTQILMSQPTDFNGGEFVVEKVRRPRRRVRFVPDSDEVVFVGETDDEDNEDDRVVYEVDVPLVGDTGDFGTPNHPATWLFWANLDRLWNLWQEERAFGNGRRNARNEDFNGWFPFTSRARDRKWATADDRLDTFNVRIADLLHPERQLCYMYADPSESRRQVPVRRSSDRRGRRFIMASLLEDVAGALGFGSKMNAIPETGLEKITPQLTALKEQGNGKEEAEGRKISKEIRPMASSAESSSPLSTIALVIASIAAIVLLV